MCITYNISMYIRHYLLLFLTILTFQYAENTYALAEDQLVYVQAVSNTGRTFAIRKGALDGVSIGQQSLFSSSTMSIKAQLVEVNRYFSVWKVLEERGSVPFIKGDLVTYTNSFENMWSYLPELFKKPNTGWFKKSSRLVFKSTYSYGISESTSETSDDSTTSRTGLQFEFLYAKNYLPNWEWMFGVRMDRDVASLSQANITANTNRYLITGEYLYYFNDELYKKYRVYVGAAVSFGISNTTIDESVSSGTALILPIIKLGLSNRMNEKYNIITEFAVESIGQKETFLDEEAQTTNIINTKLTVGVKF